MKYSLTWDDSLLCNDESTDIAHKEIFDRYESLIECLSNGRKSAVIKEHAIYLIDYMIEHFHEEDELMKKEKYPDLVRHMREHIKYIKKLTEILLNISNDPSDPLSHIELLASFSLVIAEHIKKADKKLVNFMQKKEEPNLIGSSNR